MARPKRELGIQNPHERVKEVARSTDAGRTRHRLGFAARHRP